MSEIVDRLLQTNASKKYRDKRKFENNTEKNKIEKRLNMMLFKCQC